MRQWGPERVIPKLARAGSAEERKEEWKAGGTGWFYHVSGLHAREAATLEARHSITWTYVVGGSSLVFSLVDPCTCDSSR